MKDTACSMPYTWCLPRPREGGCEAYPGHQDNGNDGQPGDNVGDRLRARQRLEARSSRVNDVSSQ
jgi:hypothetical protein